MKIFVPKPPKRAFNPDRPASNLLKAQIEHLEWAARPAPVRLREGTTAGKPRSERQAAAYIHELTERLRPAPAGAATVSPDVQPEVKKKAAKPAKQPARKRTGKPVRKRTRKPAARTRRTRRVGKAR
jgi:hypothetical protein